MLCVCCYLVTNSNKRSYNDAFHLVPFLAPLTIVRRSLSDTNLSVVRRPASGVRRPSAYVNFFKLLLLLHFSMDSLETRYTYFLGQSPNFVLFRILKFGFSDFLLIFIKIHWNCYFSYIFQSILLKLGTLVSWVSPQTLFFLEFWNLDFLIFYEFSSNFHWNR